MQEKKAMEESNNFMTVTTSSQSTQSWQFLKYTPHAMSHPNPHSTYYGMKCFTEGIGGKTFN